MRVHIFRRFNGTAVFVRNEGTKAARHTNRLFQEVKAKTPTVFKLKYLKPAKQVTVKVNVGQFGQEREARFTTTSDKSQWKIAA